MATALVHFEIQASDIERATKFYTEVFDWKIERYGDMEYWGVYTGRSKDRDGKEIGINGGLLPRRGPDPVDGAGVGSFVCTMEVEDLDAMIKRIETAGGKVVVAKTAIAGMMWQAYCKDTEGNIFGIIQNDPNAK